MFSLGVPFILSLVAFDKNNAYLWKLYLATLGLSLVAYFVADKAIDQFKESLEKNGLSGRDLNKAGAREDKPAV